MQTYRIKTTKYAVTYLVNKGVHSWTVVVVKWSLCSPYTPTIRVRIQLKVTVFPLKFVFEKNENEQKEAEVGPTFKPWDIGR